MGITQLFMKHASSSRCSSWPKKRYITTIILERVLQQTYIQMEPGYSLPTLALFMEAKVTTAPLDLMMLWEDTPYSV